MLFENSLYLTTRSRTWSCYCHFVISVEMSPSCSLRSFHAVHCTSKHIKLFFHPS